MMTIYYTHEYNNNKGESHRLLEAAVLKHISHRTDADTSAGDVRKEAARMVSSMRTEGEFGKPYIPGFAPFSISHSNNTWAVLFADTDCGLDVQYARKTDAEAVAGRFFAHEDAALISKSGDKDRVFFRMWVRREALVKAAGTSVAGSDIPSVTGNEALYKGVLYSLEDIAIPGSSAYAAVCIRAAGTADEELIIRELS